MHAAHRFKLYLAADIGLWSKFILNHGRAPVKSRPLLYRDFTFASQAFLLPVFRAVVALY